MYMNMALNIPYIQPLALIVDNQPNQKTKSTVDHWTIRSEEFLCGYPCITNTKSGKEKAIVGKHGEIFEFNQEILRIRVWNAGLIRSNPILLKKFRDKYKNAPIKNGSEALFDIHKSELEKYINILKVPKDRGRQLARLGDAMSKP